MKTTREWLKTIEDDGVKIRALANFFDSGGTSIIVGSLEQAMGVAFDWEMSTEGWEYWEDIEF